MRHGNGGHLFDAELKDNSRIAQLESRIILLETNYNLLKSRLDICCPPVIPFQSQNFTCNWGMFFNINYFDAANVYLGTVVINSIINGNNGLKYVEILRGASLVTQIKHYQQDNNASFTMMVESTFLRAINNYNVAEKIDVPMIYIGAVKTVIVPKYTGTINTYFF